VKANVTVLESSSGAPRNFREPFGTTPIQRTCSRSRPRRISRVCTATSVKTFVAWSTSCQLAYPTRPWRTPSAPLDSGKFNCGRFGLRCIERAGSDPHARLIDRHLPAGRPSVRVPWRCSRHRSRRNTRRRRSSGAFVTWYGFLAPMKAIH